MHYQPKAGISACAGCRQTHMLVLVIGPLKAGWLQGGCNLFYTCCWRQPFLTACMIANQRQLSLLIRMNKVVYGSTMNSCHPHQPCGLKRPFIAHLSENKHQTSCFLALSNVQPCQARLDVLACVSFSETSKRLKDFRSCFVQHRQFYDSSCEG